VEPDEHIAALDADGALLAAAAGRAGLDAPIPGCPLWKMRELLRHTGYVHRWAARYVTHGYEEEVDRYGEDELLRAGPGDAELIGWFRDGHAGLVRSLRSADPGLSCWTFLDAPSPLAFWARRQAHETAIHRADAESAAGDVTPFPAVFAADGIDELLVCFASRGGVRAPARRLLVRTADTGDEWLAEVGTGITARRVTGGGEACGAGGVDCVVAGTASELYLLLWNRLPDGGSVTVSGDPELLRTWQDQVQVRWAPRSLSATVMKMPRGSAGHTSQKGINRGGGGDRTLVLQYLTRASPGAACSAISQPRRSLQASRRAGSAAVRCPV
jgi:uncharacterized protein (TIGR03083 family)